MCLLGREAAQRTTKPAARGLFHAWTRLIGGFVSLMRVRVRLGHHRPEKAPRHGKHPYFRGCASFKLHISQQNG